LCDEVLPYFILRVEVFHSLNLNLNQKNLNLYKNEFKVNLNYMWHMESSWQMLSSRSRNPVSTMHL
jgi:hypothetical protein